MGEIIDRLRLDASASPSFQGPERRVPAAPRISLSLGREGRMKLEGPGLSPLERWAVVLTLPSAAP